MSPRPPGSCCRLASRPSAVHPYHPTTHAHPSFSVDDLKELLKHAKVKPVVNQILLHPYVIKTQQPLLDYLHSQHIVPEGYSTLIPITSQPGGPVDKPVQKIADKYGKQPAQILLAWSKAKG